MDSQTPTETTQTPEKMLNWNSFPAEIRAMILEWVALHPRIAPYAAVSMEWRSAIEKKTFRRLRVEQSCLDELEQYVVRQRGFVRHIWLNIQLREYICQCCRFRESTAWILLNDKIIRDAILKLFTILSTWGSSREGDLILELNAYSPSDSSHWFKKEYFGSPSENNPLEAECHPRGSSSSIDDRKHGWRNGKRVGAPPDSAIRRLYELVEINFQEDLPEVHAVTSFSLRRQCRRQFFPITLWQLWAKLPRLQNIIYEPWQNYDHPVQSYCDKYYRKMVGMHLPESLKTLTLFEDYNDDHLTLLQRDNGPGAYLRPDLIRVPTVQVAEALTARSLKLEKLSVAFLTDALQFFCACQPHWTWDHLQFLALTARSMTKEAPSEGLTDLLCDAAAVALRMPTLQTMAIWNGSNREACAFKYRREDASIIWRGTWEFTFEVRVLQAWKKVVHEYARRELQAETQLLACEIQSHGDAIYHLDLPPVLDPVSMWQIRRENS